MSSRVGSRLGLKGLSIPSAIHLSMTAFISSSVHGSSIFRFSSTIGSLLETVRARGTLFFSGLDFSAVEGLTNIAVL